MACLRGPAGWGVWLGSRGPLLRAGVLVVCKLDRRCLSTGGGPLECSGVNPAGRTGPEPTPLSSCTTT